MYSGFASALDRLRGVAQVSSVSSGWNMVLEYAHSLKPPSDIPFEASVDLAI